MHMVRHQAMRVDMHFKAGLPFLAAMRLTAILTKNKSVPILRYSSVPILRCFLVHNLPILTRYQVQ